MNIKLNDSEIKIMDVLWREGDLPAKKLSDVLEKQVGWEINTTYTLLRRCIKKGIISRSEPHFICHALITKEQVQDQAAAELIDKVFDGSADLLFASIINRRTLTPEEIARLKQIVKDLG